MQSISNSQLKLRGQRLRERIQRWSFKTNVNRAGPISQGKSNRIKLS